MRLETFCLASKMNINIPVNMVASFFYRDFQITINPHLSPLMQYLTTRLWKPGSSWPTWGSKMADAMDNAPSKEHRKRQAGPKADKKKKKKHDPSAQRNPKAFSFNSYVKAARQFHRKQDVETKRHHAPLVDRTPLEPPPYIVAIVGPPKVGKTTLINSLLKNFTRQHLSDVKGPITVVSGKLLKFVFKIILKINNNLIN